jgi:hypothetical protein
LIAAYERHNAEVWKAALPDQVLLASEEPVQRPVTQPRAAG